MKKAYGRRHFDNQIEGRKEDTTGGAQSPDGVLDAMEDALLNVSPKPRYLVHGGPWLLDFAAVSLNVLIPSSCFVSYCNSKFVENIRRQDNKNVN